MEIADFSYMLSSEIQTRVRFKLLCCVGKLLQKNPFVAERIDQITIEAQLFANNKPLSLPLTSYGKPSDNPVDSGGISCQWNEWIVFPIPYSSLPPTTCLVLTLFTCTASGNVTSQRALGGSTLRLFSKNNILKKGRHALHIRPWVVGDGSMETSTPSHLDPTSERSRLQKTRRKYDIGQIIKVDWMDKLVLHQIESIHLNAREADKILELMIELPTFDLPLIYNEKEYALSLSAVRFLDSDLVSIYDGELCQDNPVENKHRRLVRSHRHGALDRQLKPNAKIRDELVSIIRYPPTKVLSPEEKDLLWKFRFYLTRDKKALTKFLKCVTWNDVFESRQAVDLLGAWLDIDVEDALELLGPGFDNGNVRGYAVNTLKRADDDELQLYLLQLVQALKFEGIASLESCFDSPLVEFLIERSLSNPVLGVYLFWYLKVEIEDTEYGKMYADISFHFMDAMNEIPDGFHTLDTLTRQESLVSTLAKLSKDLKASKENRLIKIEKLQKYIADPKNGLLSFPPLPLPLDPHVHVTGLIPDKATIFKSALLPLRLTFSCLDGSEYTILFKTGDDLRQDQLVVQMITLMDRLLRKENLDLKLTPYKVLATGSDQGMMQFIPSLPIATILSQNASSLIPYLTHNGPIPSDVLDTYIKSTSGYCVITYLLGIGDRHLDNLMLTKSGHLFHIDFGFILGRDPKPFPPPMKVCKEMVECMGGTTSPSFNTFKSYCFISFNVLRKSANLVLNLWGLMVSSRIPDICIEPDKTVFKIQERFRLDLGDEESVYFLNSVLGESVGAFFPQVMEQLHKVAQLLRS